MEPSRFEPNTRIGAITPADQELDGAREHALAARARPPVVVLAGGVTALGVIRAFGRRGVTTYVHPDTSEYIRHSRWYQPLLGDLPRSLAESRSVSALREVLERSGLEHAFLCPCSDDWTRAVSDLAELAGHRFLSVVPTPVALDRLQDKGRLAELLQELGVPMPLTRLIQDESDLSHLPQSTETFYFLKPTDSQLFLAHFGTKGMRVRTIEEARRRLREIIAAGMSVVLQEYIPGPCTEHYFVDGYVDRAGRIKALFARRRLRIYPPDFGNSTAMVSIPLNDVQQAVNSVCTVLHAVGYHGIFSGEFKRDPRDGRFKLLEINTRPWWFIDFAVRCGVDVCRMAYDDALGLPVAAVGNYKVGVTCVFPYYDFFAVQPMLADGRMTWRRWMHEIAAALQPVACWDDPFPATVAFSRIFKSAVRNRLQRPALAAR